MSKLTIVVHVVSKPNHLKLVHDAMRELVSCTRKEAGCEQFDLHQDNEDPNHLMLFEIWTSRQHWLDHRETDHLKAYRLATENAIASFNLTQLTQIL